jgi:hypothetical protein
MVAFRRALTGHETSSAERRSTTMSTISGSRFRVPLALKGSVQHRTYKLIF